MSTDLTTTCPLCSETAAYIGYGESGTGRWFNYQCPAGHAHTISESYPEVELARMNEEELAR